MTGDYIKSVVIALLIVVAIMLGVGTAAALLLGAISG